MAGDAFRSGARSHQDGEGLDQEGQCEERDQVLGESLPRYDEEKGQCDKTRRRKEQPEEPSPSPGAPAGTYKHVDLLTPRASRLMIGPAHPRSIKETTGADCLLPL